MLNSAARLKKEAEFSRVFASGIKLRLGTILLIKLPTGEPARFGVVVSKKVSKLATRRNYLRRLLLHRLRKVVEEFSPTGDIVALVLSSGLTNDQLGELLSKKATIEFLTK